MTTIIYVIVFGNIAKISTDGIPQLVILPFRYSDVEIILPNV